MRIIIYVNKLSKLNEIFNLKKKKNYLEWSAALTVASVCMSILSMLSSAVKKVKLQKIIVFYIIIKQTFYLIARIKHLILIFFSFLFFLLFY